MKVEIKESCSCGAIFEFSMEYDKYDYANMQQITSQKQAAFQGTHAKCKRNIPKFKQEIDAGIVTPDLFNKPTEDSEESQR